MIWLLYYALILVVPPMAGGIFAWRPDESLLIIFLIGLAIAVAGYFLPGY
ncbi:hypothetical protein [Methanocella arvoryzae]|nr:hypothetical protein [Methanocella arvoryzae]